jgi:hypothetical protein
MLAGLVWAFVQKDSQNDSQKDSQPLRMPAEMPGIASTEAHRAVVG